MVQLYQLNIAHHLYHLVDWKFQYCLNFRAQNRRRLKKWKTLLILFMIAITAELTTKKAVMKKKLQLPLKLISQNCSVTLTVVAKKKTSTLTLILMKQLTWPLINFLLLKQNFKEINKAFWLTCDVYSLVREE